MKIADEDQLCTYICIFNLTHLQFVISESRSSIIREDQASTTAVLRVHMPQCCRSMYIPYTHLASTQCEYVFDVLDVPVGYVFDVRIIILDDK